ncbi:MAG TPA: DUF4430 domain-containing protein [Candidatus Saccharimonadales bacterium]|nr:DUF4430 domain-containing protein [Candidatus Saccharimonadales bacterium]
MKLTRKFALAASAVLVTAAIAIFATVSINNKPKDSASDQPAQQSSSQQQTAERSDLVSYKGVNGKNALELLKEVAQVETKDSSYGVYVDAINGIKGGTDGKYWTFYVNGAMSNTGADAYQTKDGEVVEWKFQ